jgi:hypothetical protein
MVEGLVKPLTLKFWWLAQLLRALLKRGKVEQLSEMIVFIIAGGRGVKGASQRIQAKIGHTVMMLTHSYEERRDWGKSCNMINCLLLLSLT